MSAQASASPEHPSPHGERVKVWWLLGALAAGPAAWALQLIVGYGLSSVACYPHDAPALTSPPPGWGGEIGVLATLNLACLVLAVAGAAVSLVHWRRTRGEKPGGVRQVVDAGEGRTRFLAACGVLAGAGFTVAILFDTAVIFGAPACWSIVS